MATVTATSPTPNPDAMKFSLDTRIEGMVNITSAADAVGNPFALAMFATPGVSAVFATADFVTVTREAGAAWDVIAAAVEQAAAEHL
jgi:ammonia channel protein AmtB